ncbi:hypothetical protein K491DRAFT_759573 [Lophiostoma macrostomum CBS 122681]|uniref:Secreted protein n=1 Tax=Lophiostoma macrostomum CBS 122681 TaxID=1314788 RepID=A0A6A6T1E3_9PLEO|nr:hypothetical protein K491DRAFT_759573 [Lophiostoma macrostomum CBS 122681]
MRLIFIGALLASFAGALPAPLERTLDLTRSILARAPPEANPVLKYSRANGSGCVDNSASFLFKEDATVVFDSFTLVHTKPSTISRICTLTFDLQLDSHWKYTINERTEARGYKNGAPGYFQATYQVNGRSTITGADINGSVTKDNSWALHLRGTEIDSAYGGGVTTIDIALVMVSTEDTPGVVALDTMNVGFAYSK